MNSARMDVWCMVLYVPGNCNQGLFRTVRTVKYDYMPNSDLVELGGSCCIEGQEEGGDGIIGLGDDECQKRNLGLGVRV